MSEREQLLTPRDVAELTAVSLRTVMRLIKDGDLPSITVGHSRRIRPADLDTYLNRGTEE